MFKISFSTVGIRVNMLVKIKQLFLRFDFLKGKPDLGVIASKFNLSSGEQEVRGKVAPAT